MYIFYIFTHDNESMDKINSLDLLHYKLILSTAINKCSPNPCKNAGACFELNNDYICNCPQGFKGKTCEGQYLHLCILKQHEIYVDDLLREWKPE